MNVVHIRRPPFPSRPARLLLIAGLALGGLAIIAAACGGSSAGASPQPVDGIPCESSEQLTYHVHAHLTIFVNGQQVAVPALIGIDEQKPCIYWLHTHDNTGVIHIEAPSQKQFTLGEFFDVWGQPLSATQLLGNTADASHQVRAFVGGQPYTGDPRSVPLTAHADIVLEFGPPFPQTPGPYPFAPGL